MAIVLSSSSEFLELVQIAALEAQTSNRIQSEIQYNDPSGWVLSAIAYPPKACGVENQVLFRKFSISETGRHKFYSGGACRGSWDDVKSHLKRIIKRGVK